MSLVYWKDQTSCLIRYPTIWICLIVSLWCHLHCFPAFSINEQARTIDLPGFGSNTLSKSTSSLEFFTHRISRHMSGSPWWRVLLFLPGLRWWQPDPTMENWVCLSVIWKQWPSDTTHISSSTSAFHLGSLMNYFLTGYKRVKFYYSFWNTISSVKQNDPLQRWGRWCHCSVPLLPQWLLSQGPPGPSSVLLLPTNSFVISSPTPSYSSLLL